jgi:hypothetical protein
MKPALLGRCLFLGLCALAFWAAGARAQGVTSGSITGTVSDPQDRPVSGATVVAVHEPSGSRYQAVSREDGRFTLPGLRVGGPYTVTASLAGFQPQPAPDVIVNLGTTTDLALSLGSVAATEDITVTAQASDVFSSARTGAATTIIRDVLATLPRIRDRLDEFARLTPQYAGGAIGGAYAGADNRMNNITVDGSNFNTFGGGQPGDRTNVAPITTEALEEIQVSVAPYDVRQGNFVGAGVNSVTRSGGNTFRGSAYYWFRDDSLVGKEAKGLSVDPGTFEFDKWGGWASGPLIKDKLFFFLSYEDETEIRPGTTYRANQGDETVEGNVTRVLASDLDALSNYLRQSFQYETGPYQDYSHETEATRYLAKLNYNISDRSKLSVRYTQLDSITDQLVSDSALLGFGNRRTRTTALNFQNSNYQVIENIRSLVGEWSSVLGTNRANNLIIGYTYQDESRASRGELFPMIDILEQGSVYTTFGFEPFTPKSELRYQTFQVQDNFTWNRGSHALTFGASAERFGSENVFFPGSQGVYVYNSLADFYADANDYLVHPARTASPVALRRFEVRWMNMPDMDKPIQPLEVWYTGLYAQDEWQASQRLKLTCGLRLDVPFFGDTGYRNAEADALTFRDEHGNPVRYDTKQLPEANVLWSPRVGFNWDLDGSRKTQLRGGTGVFTGRPVYLWISSQIAGTGVLTGFERLDNTRQRPFNPSPDAHKPTSVTGAPASSYELALTDPAFKFPQVWRSNLALDRRLRFGLIGTLEGLYTRDVNGISFINANLPAAQSRLVGADDRPRWTANRIHSHVTSAVVLGNQDEGDAWNVAASLSKSYRAGFLKAAYAYTRSRSMVEPGSIGVTAWSAIPHSGDPNNPGVEYFAHGHRAFLAGSYRFDYRKWGATTFSFFFEGRNAGNASYTFQGDLNGDGGTPANDLVYIPRDVAEMNFQAFTSGGRTFTAAEQAAAWDAYITQDSYLSTRRGRYAGRNGVLLPMVWRLDFSVAQELLAERGGRRHALQLRADFLNFTNLLDGDWGVARRLVSAQPLTNPGVDAQGRATYRLRAINNQLMSRSLQPSTTLQDVYRVQLSVKYSFD